MGRLNQITRKVVKEKGEYEKEKKKLEIKKIGKRESFGLKMKMF